MAERQTKDITLRIPPEIVNELGKFAKPPKIYQVILALNNDDDNYNEETIKITVGYFTNKQLAEERIEEIKTLINTIKTKIINNNENALDPTELAECLMEYQPIFLLNKIYLNIKYPIDTLYKLPGYNIVSNNFKTIVKSLQILYGDNWSNNPDEYLVKSTSNQSLTTYIVDRLTSAIDALL